MGAADDSIEKKISFGNKDVKHYDPTDDAPVLHLPNQATIGPDMIDQYKEIFNYFDKDQSGGISREEFKDHLKGIR